MSETSPLPAPEFGAAGEDDASCVRLAQAGDREAFGVLMRRHHATTYRLVLSVVRNEQDAADVCQEVWVSVWQRLGAFRGEARFTTWLHPIAVRRSLDHLRKRRRWYDRFLPFRTPGPEDAAGDTPGQPAALEPVDTAPDARLALERAERRAHYERLLQELPPLQRTVLALRDGEGMSYEDIARHLGCPVGTVMSRLHHARRALARHLQDLP